MTFITMGKFILPMVDSEVFFVTKVNEAIVPLPAIRMNDAFETYVTSNNRLQHGSSAIRNNFGEYFPVAFKNTKNNCFTESSTATFSPLCVGRQNSFHQLQPLQKKEIAAHNVRQFASEFQ